MKGLLIPGYWNSGTTLLVELLRRHPEVQLPRGRFLPNLEERSTRKWLPNGFIDLGPGYERILQRGWEAHEEPALTEAEIRRFRRRFGWAFWVWPGKTLLAKNPWWFFIPGLLDQVFSHDQVRYLLVFREGIHQVVSKHYWERGPFPPEEQLRRRALFWAMCVDYYEANWHGRPEVLTLDYGDICADPQQFMIAICQHAGLDPAPLLPHVPSQLDNRTRHWDQLDPKLQEMVAEIVQPAQARLDTLLGRAEASAGQ